MVEVAEAEEEGGWEEEEVEGSSDGAAVEAAEIGVPSERGQDDKST